MLTELAIRNFAIADALDLEFQSGLLAITGETGAGKSLLVNALAFVLGERAQAEWIRTGADRCEVTAVFTWPRDSLPMARELGLDTDEPLILRREFTTAGRGRVWVCDRPSSVATLRRLGKTLCDLHGQHQHQWLLDPQAHVAYLDASVDPGVREEYRQAFDQRERCRAALAAARDEIADAAGQKEFWEYQQRELERIDPRPDEYEELTARRDRIKHAAQLGGLYHLIEAELEAADDSVVPRLDQLSDRLRQASQFDSELSGWSTRLSEARELLEEVARESAGRRDTADESPAALEKIEARLHALYGLKKKFGGSLENAIAQRDRLAERLARVADADHTLKQLSGALSEADEIVSEAGGKLFTARSEAAARLCDVLRKPLSRLGLGRDAITLRHRELPRDQWHSDGPDQVEFLLCANPNEEPRPLTRVASGGELSRVMLALKSVLPGGDRVGTLVFDEIDSGIGGETATRVADMLAGLAKGRQVLVITHLHQIAARADRQWSVDKKTVRGRSVPVVVELDSESRIEALGRLIAGGAATPQSRAAARTLVDNGSGG